MAPLSNSLRALMVEKWREACIREDLYSRCVGGSVCSESQKMVYNHPVNYCQREPIGKLKKLSQSLLVPQEIRGGGTFYTSLFISYPQLFLSARTGMFG